MTPNLSNEDHRAMDDDASESDPRAFYPAFAEAGASELDATGMEAYDEDLAITKSPLR